MHDVFQVFEVAIVHLGLDERLVLALVDVAQGRSFIVPDKITHIGEVCTDGMFGQSRIPIVRIEVLYLIVRRQPKMVISMVSVELVRLIARRTGPFVVVASYAPGIFWSAVRTSCIHP